jgi:hypothetical protein
LKNSEKMTIKKWFRKISHYKKFFVCITSSEVSTDAIVVWCPLSTVPLKKGGFSKSEKMLYGPPPHNGKIFGRRPKILVKNDKKMVHFFSIFKKIRLRRAKNRDFSQKFSPAAG